MRKSNQRSSGSSIPTSFSPAPQPNKTQIKLSSSRTQRCKDDPNGLGCLEEKLSNLRSQTRVWDIGTESKRLEPLIKKKRMIC